MQSDLATALNEPQQRPDGGRLTRECRAQFVLIVDQNEVVRAIPGVAVQQLLLGQPGRREPIAEDACQFGERPVDVFGGVGVRPHSRTLDPPDE